MVSRSISFAAFFLGVLGACGTVSAYVPSKVAGGKLSCPSFLNLARQQQNFSPNTKPSFASRCRPILFASEPEIPLQESMKASDSSASEIENEARKKEPSTSIPSLDNALDFDINGLGVKIALGVVAAVAAYIGANMLITTATEYFTYLQENFWDILAGLPETLWGIVTAIYGFLKVFLPKVGEFGKSAYEIASPIVSETSQRAIEVAAPVLQDTAEKVADVAGPLLEEASKTANEAAAPYVEQLNTAVETSIVTPIQDAKDAMGDAVDAQIQGASKVVESQIQDATKIVDSQIQGAAKSMGDALDSQFKKFFPWALVSTRML